MRRSGRTERMVHAAARHIAQTLEPVMVVASTQVKAKELVERVQREAEGLLGHSDFPPVVGMVPSGTGPNSSPSRKWPVSWMRSSTRTTRVSSSGR